MVTPKERFKTWATPTSTTHPASSAYHNPIAHLTNALDNRKTSGQTNGRWESDSHRDPITIGCNKGETYLQTWSSQCSARRGRASLKTPREGCFVYTNMHCRSVLIDRIMETDCFLTRRHKMKRESFYDVATYVRTYSRGRLIYPYICKRKCVKSTFKHNVIKNNEQKTKRE